MSSQRHCPLCGRWLTRTRTYCGRLVCYRKARKRGLNLWAT